MSTQAINDAFWNLLITTGNVLQQIPGLDIVVRYIRRSYQNDPVRVVIELAVFFFAIYYILKKDESKDTSKLTEEEIDLLVREWEPEPLVPTNQLDQTQDEIEISGPSNLKVVLSTGEELQNWSIHNFLGLQNNPELTKSAIDVVREYGVGACGPAGFYGSMDVHLALEKDLADSLNVEEAIVYAQGFMAVASVIPAFCKRGDILVADDGCSFAIQIGLEISRSHVYFFKHNDMDDLQRVLGKVDLDCKRKKMPLSRRFIAVEGLYLKHGDKCPLPELLSIKKKYKYRLIVDESLSFGCLGPRGLGISDYYGIPASEIEIITGAFNNSLGSSGGFCAGSHHIVDHQRLSSQAYCFSAALPAMFAVATSTSLKQLKNNPKILERMRRNVEIFNEVINNSLPQKFIIIGDKDSPLRHLSLAPGATSDDHIKCMNKLVTDMRKRGYLITMNKYVHQREKFIPSPSIKLCISAGFTESETRSFSHSLIDSMISIK